MEPEFQSVASAFGLDTLTEVQELSGGKINRTYKVTSNGKHYVLQKINTDIFTNPESVMENAVRVSSYLAERSPEACVVQFCRATDGRYLFHTEASAAWRMMHYIEGVGLTVCRSASEAAAIGTAFGSFAAELQDFDISCLRVVLPDFHNTPLRFRNLFSYAKQMGAKLPELEMLYEMQEHACFLWKLYAAGKLPLRTTHNDTKCSNVLLHPHTGNPVAVIDLDTVMPGLPAYDYGDAIRSVCSTGTEQERLEKHHALTEAYLSQTKGMLTENETHSLTYGPFCITAELAARYLLDYLRTDGYFRESRHLERVQQCLSLAQWLRERVAKSQ